jgi:hypothetical protein
MRTGLVITANITTVSCDPWLRSYTPKSEPHLKSSWRERNSTPPTHPPGTPTSAFDRQGAGADNMKNPDCKLKCCGYSSKARTKTDFFLALIFPTHAGGFAVERWFPALLQF